MTVLLAPGAARATYYWDESHKSYPTLPTHLRGELSFELREKNLKDVFAMLDPASTQRADWYGALRALEEKRAVWSLQACLTHPDEDVQIKALEALKRLGDSRAVPFLLIYAQYMAVPEEGEGAANHGIIHIKIAEAASELTGKDFPIHVQNPERLKEGVRIWMGWLSESQKSDLHTLPDIVPPEIMQEE